MKFYLDTSVFGGYYDPEFSEDTVLFEEIAANKFDIVRSSLLDEEIGNAPPRVREVINKIPIEPIEYVRVDQEAIKLASAYVEAGVLSKNFEDDAIHIALATINRVDTLVSWNFKHMVRFFRIRQYDSVNLRLDYSTIDIRSPKEVLP